MDLLLAFVLAMSVTMALIPALTRLAGRFDVLDAPGPRKVHTRPIPRIGGVAMVSGALLPLVLWLGGDARLSAFLPAALLLVAAGVWDDRVSLDWQPKLAAQLLAAAIVVGWGDVLIESVAVTGRVELPYLAAVPLTVLFIVGVTNAVNLADGLDGLAGGTTLLCCCAIAMLALTVDARFVATIAIVLAGSILGFLRYNTYPARVFMGDGGSQFLGFTVAVLSVMVTQHAQSPVAAALPLLLLGLPIIDTLSVMAQRILEGRSPFVADANHIHHRLLGLGCAHHEAVVVIYVLQGALFLAAWLLRYESDVAILATFAAFAATVLSVLSLAASRGWRRRPASAGPTAPPLRSDACASADRFGRSLPGLALGVVGLAAAAYSVRTAAVARDVPADVGWLALVLAVATILTLAAARRGPARDWLAHAVLYVGAVLIVYIDVTASPPLPGPIALAGIAVFAGAVMLCFQLAGVRRFRLTTLDVLVIFVALALPNLPGSIASPRELGLAAVKLLVLFYGIELIIGHSDRARAWLLLGGAVVLSTIAMRSLH